MVPEMEVKPKDVQYATSGRRPVEMKEMVTSLKMGRHDIVLQAGSVQFSDAAGASNKTTEFIYLNAVSHCSA